MWGNSTAVGQVIMDGLPFESLSDLRPGSRIGTVLNVDRARSGDTIGFIRVFGRRIGRRIGSEVGRNETAQAEYLAISFFGAKRMGFGIGTIIGMGTPKEELVSSQRVYSF